MKILTEQEEISPFIQYFYPAVMSLPINLQVHLFCLLQQRVGYDLVARSVEILCHSQRQHGRIGVLVAKRFLTDA